MVTLLVIWIWPNSAALLFDVTIEGKRVSLHPLIWWRGGNSISTFWCSFHKTTPSLFVEFIADLSTNIRKKGRIQRNDQQNLPLNMDFTLSTFSWGSLSELFIFAIKTYWSFCILVKKLIHMEDGHLRIIVSHPDLLSLWNVSNSFPLEYKPQNVVCSIGSYFTLSLSLNPVQVHLKWWGGGTIINCTSHDLIQLNVSTWLQCSHCSCHIKCVV